MIDYYKISAASGFFGKEIPNQFYNGIDIRKCYTHSLTQINKIPVFNYFDIFKKYNNETIEPYNYYIIKRLKNDNITSILYPNLFNMTFGFTLQNIPNDSYKIIYVMRPSNIYDVNFKNLVDELYKVKIDNDDDFDKILKKSIVNVSTGLLERKYNKKSNVSLFFNYDDAYNYARLFKGKVKPIIKYKDIVKVEKNPLDVGVEKNTDDDNNENLDIQISNVVDKKLYAVIIEKEKELTSNFRQIKDMIYELSKLELIKVYNKLESNGYIVKGVKTDCILFKGQTKTEEEIKYIESNNNITINKEKLEKIKIINNSNKLEDIFDNFNDGIGRYKLEKNKYLNVTPLNKVLKNNLLEILDISTTLHDIKDEYNKEEFKNIFDNHQTIVLGDMPGVGKSTSVKLYDPDCLFVTPFNKLSQENKRDGIESITNNKLLGKHVIDTVNFEEYDVSKFKIICFDEIFLYSDNELKQIDKYIKKNPYIKFAATGDIDQLRDFRSYNNNIIDHEDYKKKCIDMIFKHQIILHENKRLKYREDKLKLRQLKKEIFSQKIIRIL